MKRSTVVRRSALQLAALFLAGATVTFAGEPDVSAQKPQLIGHMVVTAAPDPVLLGHMVVTAAPERALLGNMVVTATRVARTNTLVADLGAMTVTAPRVTTLARNDAQKAASLHAAADLPRR
jgi:hypothetical protein